GQSWYSVLKDLEGALPFLSAIRPHEVKVLPIGSDLGPKVCRTAERFEMEEFIFGQAGIPATRKQPEAALLGPAVDRPLAHVELCRQLRPRSPVFIGFFHVSLVLIRT